MFYFYEPVYLLLLIPLGIVMVYTLSYFAVPPVFNPPSLQFYRRVEDEKSVTRAGVPAELWLICIAAFFCLLALSEPRAKITDTTLSFSSFCISIAMISFVFSWISSIRGAIVRKKRIQEYLDLRGPSPIPAENVGTKWGALKSHMFVYIFLILVLILLKTLLDSSST